MTGTHNLRECDRVVFRPSTDGLRAESGSTVINEYNPFSHREIVDAEQVESHDTVDLEFSAARDVQSSKPPR